MVNDLPCSPAVVSHKVTYILKQNIFWTMVFENTKDVEEQRAPGIFKPILFACLRERLTRETSAEHIVLGNILFLNLGNIKSSVKLKIRLISINGMLINFRGKYAFPSKTLHGDVEPANTSKKINKLKVGHSGCLGVKIGIVLNKP